MLPLFAHSRHIALPPVLVYGFGAIFGKITVIEPPKISRSISDRVDYPPIRLSCFGIISVSFRCQFASSPRCRSSPESHSGVSLPLVCSFRSGFLHIPAKSHGTTSPGKHIPSFDWNNPSMNYLYHRTFLCPVPYVHKVGIKGKNQKFPRLRKV